MTYKEQADAIVDKYVRYAIRPAVMEVNIKDYKYELLQNAKQCALIDIKNSHMAVQKFIVSISNNLDGEYGNELAKEQLEKYKAIKQAIEELKNI